MRHWQPAFPSAAIVQPGARLKMASFPIVIRSLRSIGAGLWNAR